MSLVFAGVLFTQSAMMFSVEAEIFKCTNKQGAVYYNDKPCPVLDDEKKMRAEKDVINGYVPSRLKEIKVEQRKGAIVGGNTPRTARQFPEQNEKPSELQNDKSSSSGSGSGGSGSSPGDQQKITHESDESKGEMLPPKAKISKRGSDGKFTIQEKRTMLGIFPTER